MYNLPTTYLLRMCILHVAQYTAKLYKFIILLFILHHFLLEITLVVFFSSSSISFWHVFTLYFRISVKHHPSFFDIIRFVSEPIYQLAVPFVKFVWNEKMERMSPLWRCKLTGLIFLRTSHFYETCALISFCLFNKRQP